MKTVQNTIILLLLSIGLPTFAQNNVDAYVGKWITEDNTVVEIVKAGTSVSIKQTKASKPKEKINDGKWIGKNFIEVSTTEMKGIVINPEDGKEYKAILIIASDKKTMKLKVKWGLISFNETWKKL